MKFFLSRSFILKAILIVAVCTPSMALAQDVNLSDPGFKLIQCDGPETLRHLNPTTGKLDKNTDGTWVYTNPNYVSCDFQGLQKQVQFIINLMITLGVIAILLLSAWAGFLYITGTPANRDRAKKIFPKLFWGFIIMLTAWFMVYQILVWLTGTTNYLN